MNVPRAWVQEIAKYIKSLGPRKLVLDGTYGVNSTHLDIPEVDIYSDHFYPLNTTKLSEGIEKVRGAGKVYWSGEYDWTGLNGKETPQGDSLESWFGVIEADQKREDSVVAGDAFWSLFMHNVPDCQVRFTRIPLLFSQHISLEMTVLTIFRASSSTTTASRCNTTTPRTRHTSTGRSASCASTSSACRELTSMHTCRRWRVRRTLYQGMMRSIRIIRCAARCGISCYVLGWICTCIDRENSWRMPCSLIDRRKFSCHMLYLFIPASISQVRVKCVVVVFVGQQEGGFEALASPRSPSLLPCRSPQFPSRVSLYSNYPHQTLIFSHISLTATMSLV